MVHVEDDELAAIYCVTRELKECKKLVRCDGVTYVKANGLWSNDDALVDAFLLDWHGYHLLQALRLVNVFKWHASYSHQAPHEC